MRKRIRWISITLLLASLSLGAQDVIFTNSFENTAPVIVSTPVTAVQVGGQYAYDVDATDVDGDLLAYHLLQSPAGMTIDAGTGEIGWTTGSAGVYPVTVEVSDGNFGYTSQSWSITVLPPAPEDIAPDNDPTVVTTVFDSTRFLYEGEGAPQSGVAEGTIEPERAAVIRGMVMTRDGAPLPGVVVMVHGQEEFGQTLSGSDGRFDMAVNGGGQLTLDYGRDGYLPAQRQVDVPWQDIVFAPDVALVPLDPAVTNVNLATATEIQVAQGSPQSDADGNRRATVLFPPGTGAELVLPDGSTQPITDLAVRATEYTVGNNGPESMPAELPPTSGYTYAVELSVDQALNAGATMVNFDQPLPFYVENFLDFPTGTTVPSGYYDRDAAQWVPSDNGRVIEILAVVGGLAELDVEGDGLVADNAALAALGISQAEQEQLASLYGVGDSLWRVPIAHFTPWDHNWPYGPPNDAVAPAAPPPLDSAELVDGACEVPGSIIECQNQVLGERIAITGTDFTLNYRSSRQKGFRAQNSSSIPLSGDSLPPSLDRIELHLSVAGQQIRQEFAPAPNLVHDFTWDGLDGYGRAAFGSHTVNGRIHYFYPIVYYDSGDDLDNAFARIADLPVELGSPRVTGEFSITQDFTLTLGTPPRGSTPIAGWSLDVHHAFDPLSGTLYLGDGSRQRSGTMKIETTPFASCGLSYHALAIGPDGSVYHFDQCNDNGNFNSRNAIRLRKTDPDGNVTVIAGGGPERDAEGIPATEAKITGAGHIRFGPDGSIYFTEYQGDCQIRRVTPDGLIYTVMNPGRWQTCLARVSSDFDARANGVWPSDFLVMPDGRIIMTVTDSNRVYQIDRQGHASVLAGSRPPNGTQPINPYSCGLNDSNYEGDGPARQAVFCGPYHLARDDDGGIYFTASNTMILKIDPAGHLSRVAGQVRWSWTVDPPYGGDGQAALDVPLVPGDLEIATDGRVFFETCRTTHCVVRVIDPEGIVDRYAGGQINAQESGDNGPARLAEFADIRFLQLAPDGMVHFLTNSGYRRIAPVFPRYRGVGFSLPSEDGSAVYQFDDEGRHLRTLSSLTGATLYVFGYDSQGTLVSVTDGDGNVTTIQRNGEGEPTAIVGPYGAETALTVDPNGYLASVTNPAGATSAFTYTQGGILETSTDSLLQQSEYSYDALGRLLSATDKRTNTKTFARSEVEGGIRITKTSAEGEAEHFDTISAAAGQRLMVFENQLGGSATRSDSDDGIVHHVGLDGSHAVLQYDADPRFGMMSAVLGKVTAKSPGQVELTQEYARQVQLSDEGNPLSLLNVTETRTINGRQFSRSFDAGQLQFTETSALGRSRELVVDESLRPLQLTPFDGAEPVVFSYDQRGRLIAVSAADLASTFTYDSWSRVIKVTDGNGAVIAYGYDAADRLVHMTTPSNIGYQFGYDNNGNLTDVTMPSGSLHQLQWDPVGNLIGYQAPDSIEPRSWIYDRDSRLLSHDLPSGGQIALAYDNIGRLESVVQPAGSTTISHQAASFVISQIDFEPQGGGQVESLILGQDGGLPMTVAWSGTLNGSFTYAYDTNVRLSNLELNYGGDQYPRALAYDDDALVTGDGPFSIVRSGPRAAVSEISDASLKVSYGYDGLGRVTSIVHTVDSNEVFSSAYSYDSFGRVSARTDVISGAPVTRTYAFDIDGQLTEVRREGILEEEFSYDVNGNRLTSPQGTASYNARDEMLTLGLQSYGFDADGFLETRASDNFVYDRTGNLLQATVGGVTVDYTHDPLGRRVARTEDGLTEYYLYGRPDELSRVTHTVADDGTVSEYFYDDFGHIYALKRGDSWYYVATDQVGSPLLVSDSFGNAVKQIDYSAFGFVLNDSNPAFNLPIGYAGGLVDERTGLVHFAFRDYEPESGRFTSLDPLLILGGFPNLYSYAGNDPISYSDPLGLNKRSIWVEAGDKIFNFIKLIKGLLPNSKGLPVKTAVGAVDQAMKYTSTYPELAASAQNAAEVLGRYDEIPLRDLGREGATVLDCFLGAIDTFSPKAKVNVGKNFNGSYTDPASAGRNSPWKGLEKGARGLLQIAQDQVNLYIGLKIGLADRFSTSDLR